MVDVVGVVQSAEVSLVREVASYGSVGSRWSVDGVFLCRRFLCEGCRFSLVVSGLTRALNRSVYSGVD